MFALFLLIYLVKSSLGTYLKNSDISELSSTSSVSQGSTLENYTLSCYFNSCIQLLKPIKPFRKYLNEYKGVEYSISYVLKQLFDDMDRVNVLNAKLYFDQILNHRNDPNLNIGDINDLHDILCYIIDNVINEDSIIQRYKENLDHQITFDDYQNLSNNSETFKLFYFCFMTKDKDENTSLKLKNYFNSISEDNMRKNLDDLLDAYSMNDSLQILQIPKILFFVLTYPFMDFCELISDYNSTLKIREFEYKLVSFSLFNKVSSHYVACKKTEKGFDVYDNNKKYDLENLFCDSNYSVNVCVYEMVDDFSS